MDNISLQEEQSPKEKNQKSSAYRVIKFFLIILLIPLGLIVKTYTSDNSVNQETLNQIEEYAKQAVMTTYTFEKDKSYQDYIENMCEISTVYYCENQDKVFSEEEYAKIMTIDTRYEFVSSELIATHQSQNNPYYIYRINSIMYIEGHEDNMEFDEAVIMIDEDGWKVYNIMKYEAYLEIVNAE